MPLTSPVPSHGIILCHQLPGLDDALRMTTIDGNVQVAHRAFLRKHVTKQEQDEYIVVDISINIDIRMYVFYIRVYINLYIYIYVHIIVHTCYT